jgi:NADPH:quinone reductase-like Zn-dependent oxidoreductase
MPFEEAAGLPVPVETTGRAFRIVPIAPGATVLINGAAGGVGQSAVQFAKAQGAGTIIGTASPGNHDFLRELGAVPTTYGEGLVERVREIAPGGIDVAFDTAGHGVLPALVELTGDPNLVVTIASYDAADYGVHLTSGNGGEARVWEALDQAAELYEARQFHLPVEQSFPFDQAAEAHRVSEGGHVRGKLVLVPPGVV